MAIPSENDPSSPMNRREQTFPHLSEEMSARLVKYGIEEVVPAGTMLFRRGERRVDYFFVIDGSIEVYDTAEGELVLAVGNDRQFAALCEELGFEVAAREIVPDERAEHPHDDRAYALLGAPGEGNHSATPEKS